MVNAPYITYPRHNNHKSGAACLLVQTEYLVFTFHKRTLFTRLRTKEGGGRGQWRGSLQGRLEEDIGPRLAERRPLPRRLCLVARGIQGGRRGRHGSALARSGGRA
jgi:hypothetical protein